MIHDHLCSLYVLPLGRIGVCAALRSKMCQAGGDCFRMGCGTPDNCVQVLILHSENALAPPSVRNLPDPFTQQTRYVTLFGQILRFVYFEILLSSRPVRI